jgi:hypothetical protein
MLLKTLDPLTQVVQLILRTGLAFGALKLTTMKGEQLLLHTGQAPPHITVVIPQHFLPIQNLLNHLAEKL